MLITRLSQMEIHTEFPTAGYIASLFSVDLRLKFITSSCKSREDMTGLSPRAGRGNTGRDEGHLFI